MDDDTDAAQLRARIALLRREVYSREGAQSPLVDAVDPDSGASLRLRANELELRDAERRLRNLTQPDGSPDALAGTVVGTALREDQPPSGTAADQTAGDQTAGGDTAEMLPRRSRPSGLIAAASVVGVLLAAGGFALGRVQPLESPPAPVETNARAVPGPAPGLAALDSVQTPDAVPPVLLGSGIAPSSIRSFGNFGSTSQDALTYIARSVSGLVCLAVVLPDHTNSLTCVSESRFSAEGLRLRLSTAETVPAPGDEGVAEPVYYEYYWAKDGSLSMSSNSRTFAVGDGT
ncbi:hypothetical protein F1C58_10455 [Glaciihabitans sp. INWT7]|uniref:hypothetical protein n=1 Tax=Glaciihabitans sp. INWT7 TaxID=2596912 RepID=UPI00162442BB|nr:hypothetical protein [Glaciihabitans sp. INWT7]QNE47275.1 hypothetical protein F1C58_10455 [Glaciihabitans sp. INWT7]